MISVCRRATGRCGKACTLLVDQGIQRDGGIHYGWRGRSETCITGMVLSILSYFEYDDDRLDIIADHLLELEMADLPESTDGSPTPYPRRSLGFTIDERERDALPRSEGPWSSD